MTVIQLKSKSIEGAIKQLIMNTARWSRYPSIIVEMATHFQAITIAASVETQGYLVSVLVLSVEQMDAYLGSVQKCNL